MSTQVILQTEVQPITASVRLSDYVQLTRPKIAVMVLVTAWLGMLGTGDGLDGWTAALMLLGTGFVTASASALNQVLERGSDALMPRTENRPLPSGRMRPVEALLAAGGFGFLGMLILLGLPSGPLSAGIAALSLVLYVLAYTPAKRWTVWNTLIGAVPGALPPLIGWSAARGSLTWEAMPLFAILFWWQVPHFLAIAWIYREQYGLAGLRMLPNLDATGSKTALAMVASMLALAAASFWPLAWQAGWVYGLGVVLANTAFLWCIVDFARCRSRESARVVLRASLLYLPSVLALLVLDRYVS